MKPENRFLGRVNKALPEGVYAEKTANPFRRGMPDMYYEGDKGILWVEYKFYPTSPRVLNLTGTKAPPLTALQQRWLARAHSNKRNVAVIVGTPSGGFILEGVRWMEPIPSTGVPLLTVKEIASWIANTVCTSTLPAT